MVAPVSTVLGVHDIVFYRKNLDILLAADHLRNPVNIGSKRTDNAYTGNVIHVAHHVLDS